MLQQDILTRRGEGGETPVQHGGMGLVQREAVPGEGADQGEEQLTAAGGEGMPLGILQNAAGQGFLLFRLTALGQIDRPLVELGHIIGQHPGDEGIAQRTGEGLPLGRETAQESGNHELDIGQTLVLEVDEDVHQLGTGLRGGQPDQQAHRLVIIGTGEAEGAFHQLGQGVGAGLSLVEDVDQAGQDLIDGLRIGTGALCAVKHIGHQTGRLFNAQGPAGREVIGGHDHAQGGARLILTEVGQPALHLVQQGVPLQRSGLGQRQKKGVRHGVGLDGRDREIGFHRKVQVGLAHRLTAGGRGDAHLHSGVSGGGVGEMYLEHGQQTFGDAEGQLPHHGGGVAQGTGSVETEGAAGGNGPVSALKQLGIAGVVQLVFVPQLIQHGSLPGRRREGDGVHLGGRGLSIEHIFR